MDVVLSGGATVGRYRIVRPLGRGAVGTTWEAEPLEGGRRVAIKELRLSRVEDWKLVELFDREARVLAHITHPAVPAYVDHFAVEHDDEHSFYLVQTLAPGRTLAELAAAGWRADEPELRRIAESLLDILDYLHSRMPPVYHRDIKPENVLREDGGKIWLVDFGSVRDVVRATTGGSTVAGTFGYMAPEQLRGVARPESDLYGLASTLLFVASGASPSQMPQRKLKVDFRSHVRVSAPLAAWLERMIEPAPEDRFPSARRALIELRTPSRPERTGSPRRTLLLSAALMFVIAAAGVVGALELRERSSLRKAAVAALPRLPGRPEPYGFPAATWLRSFGAHFNGVMSASFTPDGARLLTSSHDATVKIWDARTGQQLRALPGHTAGGNVVVTPDGRNAISAGDRTLRVWSLPDGAAVRAIDADPDKVFDVAVSPDSRTLVSGGAGGRAKLSSLDGTELKALVHGEGRVLAVAFAPDGSRVATAGDDKTIKIWDVPEGKNRCTLRGHTATVGAIAISPDGQILASAGDDHTARLWHIQRCEAVTTLSLHVDEVWSVAFSPDGGTLLTGGKDPQIGVWALPESKLRQSIILEPGVRGTMGIAFAPDGVTFATTQGSGAVQLWKLARPTKHAPLPALAPVEPVIPAQASPERRAYLEAMEALDGYHGEPGTFAEVAKQLDALRQSAPQSALARAAQARLAFKRWQWDGDEQQASLATQLADEAIGLDPKLADAYVVRGWILHLRNDVVGARAAAETAHKLDPASFRPMTLLGMEQRAQGDDEGAERTLRDVLARPLGRHATAAALVGLVDVYTDTGDIDGADEIHRRILELEPAAPWHKDDYAMFLVRRRDYDAAIGMAQQAKYGAGLRTLANAYCAKGEELLWTRGKWQEAQDAFAQATRADPRRGCAPYGQGAVHQWLAWVNKDPHEMDQARSAYQKALAVEPSFTLARIALAAADK